MPWCPKCKNEYREGFETCVDCGTKLISELDESTHIKIASFSNEDILNKFKDYLSYSKINYYYELIDEENYITVDEKVKKDAIKALKAFVSVEKNIQSKCNIDGSYHVFTLEDIKEALLNQEIDQSSSDVIEIESEQNENEPIDNEEVLAAVQKKIISNNSTTIYESKSFKAEEMSSSGYILIAFGVLGIIFIFLNFAGVFNLLSLGFSSIIILIMFAAMFIGGIYSLSSSKKYAEEGEKEKEFTIVFKDWMKANLKPEDIKSVDLADNTPEENALLRFDYIKAKVYSEYPDIDENFAENYIEEFYNETFE